MRRYNISITVTFGILAVAFVFSAKIYRQEVIHDCYREKMADCMRGIHNPIDDLAEIGPDEINDKGEIVGTKKDIIRKAMEKQRQDILVAEKKRRDLAEKLDYHLKYWWLPLD